MTNEDIVSLLKWVFIFQAITLVVLMYIVHWLASLRR